jgi:ubiquinone/menaquinone biosynthesis C-methylase UbiE
MNKTYHDTHFSFDPGRKRVWKAITEDIQKYLNDDESILDLGCGYGDFINQISAIRKLAVDIEDMSPHLDPDVEFRQGDVRKLNFIADNSLSAVFCSNLLEHLNRDGVDSTVSEIIRVLKAGGFLICIQPNFRLCYKRYFDDYTHLTIFTDVSLCGLLAAHGLTVKKIIPRYLPFSMRGSMPKSYWLTKAYLLLRPGIMAGQMMILANKK